MVQERSNWELRVSFPCPYLFFISWIKRDAPSQALATQEDTVSTEGHHHTVQVGQQRAGQGHCSLDDILQPGWQLLRERGGEMCYNGKGPQPAFLWADSLFMSTSTTIYGHFWNVVGKNFFFILWETWNSPELDFHTVLPCWGTQLSRD